MESAPKPCSKGFGRFQGGERCTTHENVGTGRSKNKYKNSSSPGSPGLSFNVMPPWVAPLRARLLDRPISQEAAFNYRRSNGTHCMWITDITTNPASQSTALRANDSTRADNKKAVRNGIPANIATQGTPTFLPHALHVAGTLGPRHILRIREMPALPQWGAFELPHRSLSVAIELMSRLS